MSSSPTGVRLDSATARPNVFRRFLGSFKVPWIGGSDRPSTAVLNDPEPAPQAPSAAEPRRLQGDDLRTIEARIRAERKILHGVGAHTRSHGVPIAPDGWTPQ